MVFTDITEQDQLELPVHSSSAHMNNWWTSHEHAWTFNKHHLHALREQPVNITWTTWEHYYLCRHEQLVEMTHTHVNNLWTSHTFIKNLWTSSTHSWTSCKCHTHSWTICEHHAHIHKQPVNIKHTFMNSRWTHTHSWTTCEHHTHIQAMNIIRVLILRGTVCTKKC